MNEPSFSGLLIVVAVAFAAPFLLGLFPRVRLPSVVFEIVAGIVIGPSVLGWVEVDDTISVLALMGLAILLFLAGLEIDFDRLRGRLLRLALLGWAISFAIAVVVAVLLETAGLVETPLLVAIILCATSLGVIVPVLKDVGELDSKFGQLVLAAASIADFGAVILLSFFFSGEGGPGSTAVLLGAFVGLLGVTFAVVRRSERSRRIQEDLLRLQDSSAQIRVRGSMLLMVAFVALAEGLGLEVILGSFAAGALLSLLDRDRRMTHVNFRTKLEAIGFGLLIPIFFVTSGIRFDLQALLDKPSNLVMVPIFLAALLAVRGVPAVAYRRFIGDRRATIAGVLQATSLPFIVAATAIGQSLDLMDAAEASALIAAGLLSVLIFPLTGLSLLRRAMSEEGKPFIPHGSLASGAITSRARMSELTEGRRETLRAVCDTVVPRLARDDDPHGLWARAASDAGVNQGVEQLIAMLPEEQQAGMGELLDGLTEQGFAGASQLSREQILRNVALFGPEAAAGVTALIGMTLFLHYGAPDPATGQNPAWKAFGYPGPTATAPSASKTIETTTPDGDELELEADVCIVGSGAGGGVIAGTLAQQGLKICVLEAGGYFDESDFDQLELSAYERMYWRGGPNPTADMNVTLYAGAGLGGGTVINWTNCLRTRPWVREQWTRDHGLEGVDGPDFDQHLDAIFDRLSVNDRCSDLNGPQQRLKESAERLGWSFKTILRNADPSCYDPESAAYMGFGDPSGSKLSTQKTFLQDAFDAGADFVVRCTVERVLVEKGHAAGVEGIWVDPETGRSARVVVRAPQVVVACGALESPALLRRSGIGGPVVGDYLRLHPCTALFGIYDTDQKAWWGPPQAGLCDEFANVEDGYGFLVETTQYAPALVGSALPFTTAQAHREMMERVRFGATFIGLLRDHGHGRVDVDAEGQSVPQYSLEDELDVRNTHRAIDAQARLHAAGGASEIYAMAAGAPRWRRGDDLDAYVERLRRVPLRFGGFRLFAAHQMGTCRMGKDPKTSVAGPWGELHDTRGVWIGDASAFPTSSGTNPMISIMALARRTALAVAAASDRAATPVETART